jgi:hypothetical protein
MANSKSTAVTKADEKPDYLKQLEEQNAGNGQTDNFDSSDVVVPQVKLLQGLSAECEQFDDAKAGRFWHTGFDQSLGDNFDFVICSRRKKYLLLAPLEDGQGVLARAEDAKTWDRMGEWEVKLPQTKRTAKWQIGDLDVAKSGLDKWGTYDPEDNDSPPAATMFYEYLIILPDHPDWGAAVLSLSRSQIRKAKKGLNDKIQLHRSAGRPLQSLVFNAKSVDEQSASGSYKNFQFTQNGFAAKEMYDYAMELSQMLHTYQVADEGAAAQEQETTPTADSNEY